MSGRRIIRDGEFIDYIMTPPKRHEYEMNEPEVSEVKILGRGKTSDGRGLGEVSLTGGGANEWVMPVVVIVVSAMALMTLYAVLSDRKR